MKEHFSVFMGDSLMTGAAYHHQQLGARCGFTACRSPGVYFLSEMTTVTSRQFIPHVVQGH